MPFLKPYIETEPDGPVLTSLTIASDETSTLRFFDGGRKVIPPSDSRTAAATAAASLLAQPGKKGEGDAVGGADDAAQVEGVDSRSVDEVAGKDWGNLLEEALSKLTGKLGFPPFSNPITAAAPPGAEEALSLDGCFTIPGTLHVASLARARVADGGWAVNAISYRLGRQLGACSPSTSPAAPLADLLLEAVRSSERAGSFAPLLPQGSGASEEPPVHR